MADDIPALNIDRQQIKQALINLFDNAISAIRKEGLIEITLSCNSGEKNVQLVVADNGQGISDEEKTRLFEPYFSTKKSGMGLGLTIVKQIIEAHGGYITVESELDKGTTFSFWLLIDDKEVSRESSLQSKKVAKLKPSATNNYTF